MKKLSLSLKISSLVMVAQFVQAQSVIPVQSTTIIPTTAASPVVTAATTVTTTSTTNLYGGYNTMMDYYLAQAASEQAAIAAQAEAATTAQTNASQYAAMAQLALQFCPWANSSSATEKAPKDMKKVEKQAADQNEAAGNQYEKGMDQGTQQEVGQSREEVVAAEGCDIFINKEGKLGPQGRTALAVIKDNPDSFEKKVPTDIAEFCPNYKKMNGEQRQLYWVWVGLSVSSSESSCDPKNNNPNAKNGTAYGLFQMAAKSCKQKMSLPDANTRCFYTQLADELRSRGSLTTSKSGATKWGTLRTDDDNKGRAEDVPAGQKTRKLLTQYPYCQGDVSEAAAASVEDADSSSGERRPANKSKKAKPKKNQPQLI
ncbi:hypothetical protein [Bdellovibrio sp. HCB209]|uniref:hypothetical protein n=1 Tax=Bdellovibrio sp. HCB209 TaxID=3394354 RepID=UPI0039B54503